MTLYSLYYDVIGGRGIMITETTNTVASKDSDYFEFDQCFSDKAMAQAALDEKNKELNKIFESYQA